MIGSSRVPALLLALAVAVRVLVAARTEVPDRDAAAYLWMAEQVARGDLAAAFGGVFHPVYPLLVALVLAIAPRLDAVLAGQIVSCGAGALAVLPLFAWSASVFGRSAACAAGFLYAVGVWFARHPADCLSEGPFYLLVGIAVWLLGRARVAPARALAVAGVISGLAYGTRPEGAALLLIGFPWLWSRGARAGALAFALGFACGGAPWPLGYAVFGAGFTPSPKLVFNYAVGIGGDPAGGVQHYLLHLARLPGALCEALGFAAAPLALIGAWCARPWRWRNPEMLVLALFALQLAVIPFLRAHYRFVSGYGFLCLAFAGYAWQRWQPQWQTLHPALRVALVLTAVGGDLVRLPVMRRADRAVERDLGFYLRARLAPGEAIATDMPRLAYFAGVEPGPPRRIRPDDLIEACKSPRTRYAVFVAPRTAVHGADFGAAWAPAPLPQSLEAEVRARSILVFERR